MREERKARLCRLLEPVGVTGCEEGIAEAIQREIEGCVDEVRIDVMGNLIATRKGKPGAKRIMFAAHMDRIGFMVKAIEDTGFLRIAPVGGIALKSTVGRHVRFTDGTMGVLAHETEKDYPADVPVLNLFVDIGATSAEEAAQKVRIGDMCMLDSRFVDMGTRVSQGGMDNRASCGVLVELLRALQGKDVAYEIVAVFTTQEEVGLRGATTAAYAIDPDYGVALDVTPTYDTPKAMKGNCVALGKGAAIKVLDSSVVCHPLIRDWMEDAAKACGVPYQFEVLMYGGTDAGAIHKTRGGIPSGALSVPCRYVHSTSETIDMDDYDACIALLECAVTRAVER